MINATVTYLPWLLSAITIWMTILAGNKHPSAWLLGLGNQVLWLVWIVVAGAWGLLPMNLALWFVYGRNHLKWSAPEALTVDQVLAAHAQFGKLDRDRVKAGMGKNWPRDWDNFRAGEGIFS